MCCPTSCCRTATCCHRDSIPTGSTSGFWPGSSRTGSATWCPAVSLLAPWLPRDPTLEVLHLLQAWQQPREPERAYDVWFDRGKSTALLLVQTAGQGFNADSQQAALATLRESYAATHPVAGERLVITGPGAFSALMKERTQHDAQVIGIIDTVTILLLLIFAYRSASSVLLALLPLASAGITGLAAVNLCFGAVHGITLAFGFTLIGVAQDYPIHVLSHQHRGVSPVVNVRRLWPTLATGVASTCIAYLAFLFSGVTGLAQLACFSITGLAVAGLTTRYLIPHILNAAGRDYGNSPVLERLWSRIERLPNPGWYAVALGAAAVATLVLAPGPLWEDNLGALTPIPETVLDQDRAMRRALAAPDIRYLLVIEGAIADEVLGRSEELATGLTALVNGGALTGFDYPSRYLPTREVQERRQAALPDSTALRRMLAEAQARTPFRVRLFEPFLQDVEAARHLPLLTPAALAATPLGPRLDSLLSQHHDRWLGFITLTGMRNSGAVSLLARQAGTDVTLLDLKQASEQLVARQRSRILASLGIAMVLMAGVVLISLSSLARTRRVLSPMLLTTLLTLAILHAAGIGLSLFHLVSLILAAGLGLDYALFFEHAADNPAEQRRTLHALLVSSVSTFVVFAVLAMSALPVLRNIGISVALGVVGNFFLTLLLTRPRASMSDARYGARPNRQA